VEGIDTVWWKKRNGISRSFPRKNGRRVVKTYKDEMARKRWGLERKIAGKQKENNGHS
jgi:hypothetical protein